MNQCTFPFKYLGVPLPAWELRYVECKSFIHYILKAINHWSTRHLSYGARAFLVKSVLDGMKAYWTQIFIFPKKRIRKVESACRSFLWAGKAIQERPPLLGIKYVSLSNVVGGISSSLRVGMVPLLWNNFGILTIRLIGYRLSECMPTTLRVVLFFRWTSQAMLLECSRRSLNWGKT